MTGQSPTSSAYDKHLRELKAFGLSATDRPAVVATALLFPGQAVSTDV